MEFRILCLLYVLFLAMSILNICLIMQCHSVRSTISTKRKGVLAMIAERIKMLRTAQNISQAELAKKLDITRSSVNAWEQGFSIPSTGYLVELARLFHVSTDYLLGLKQNAYLDVTGLDTEQTRILYELAEHFRKEKKGNKD